VPPQARGRQLRRRERLRNERDAALARAEAAEKRCAELEVATIVCPACCESMTASQAVPVRELVARAEAAEAALESCQRARRAAERRVEELEGALRKIETQHKPYPRRSAGGRRFAEIRVAFANIVWCPRRHRGRHGEV
jgi:chaperonin cofactor prefoldin